uniref:Protein farnesyltransferase subunit beta n=1 Tax=Piliocolobus tephrosceles TaxID=591936 RepID=A0A8C9GE34_9PRIM
MYSYINKYKQTNKINSLPHDRREDNFNDVCSTFLKSEDTPLNKKKKNIQNIEYACSNMEKNALFVKDNNTTSLSVHVYDADQCERKESDTSSHSRLVQNVNNKKVNDHANNNLFISANVLKEKKKNNDINNNKKRPSLLNCVSEEDKNWAEFVIELLKRKQKETEKNIGKECGSVHGSYEYEPTHSHKKANSSPNECINLDLFESTTNYDINKLINLQIKDDILIVSNYSFELNKPSILLSKYISLLNLQLEKEKHFKFCMNIFFFKNLKLNALEASKPWIFYWCIHSIHILYNEFEIEKKINKSTFSYIKKCIIYYLNKIQNDKKDAFGGGLNQYTHIATTYAAVCVFIYLHDEENNFLSFLDKKKIYTYILKLKCKNGCFRVHKNGEIDIRGTYCAIAICSMCHMLTNKVKKNVEKYLISCQNYEGGFTSERYQESHGGYTYCALATLCILGKVNNINLNKLMLWLINKQGALEGGFMGRTNKLVDACYSFWIGSLFFLINEIYAIKYALLSVSKKKKGITGEIKRESSGSGDRSCSSNGNRSCSSNGNRDCNNSNNRDCNISSNRDCSSHNNDYLQSALNRSHNMYDVDYKKKMIEKKLFNINYLRLYLLLCSQGNNGGMKDKPTEKVDYYHTCYALSGLSLIENYVLNHIQEHEYAYIKNNVNKLNQIHILYNITVQHVYKSYNYFSPEFSLDDNKINYKVGKGA